MINTHIHNRRKLIKCPTFITEHNLLYSKVSWKAFIASSDSFPGCFIHVQFIFFDDMVSQI